MSGYSARHNRDTAFVALCAAVLLVLLALLNWASRDSLFLEQARYCHMVSMGYWPDYEDRFARLCEADGKAKGASHDPFARDE